MSEPIITIRSARESDMPLIDSYAAQEGMDAIPFSDTVFVALNADEELVGFIRLLKGNNGIYHVNPVVVYPTWRRYGVGRMLMDYALDLAGELRFVARGTSVAFYERLGAMPIGWEMVDMAVTENCDGCLMFDECGPVPFRMVASDEGNA